MAEALSRGGEDVGGFLHLVCLVPRNLTVLHQSHLLLLADLVKLLLGLFDLPKVPKDEDCFVTPKLIDSLKKEMDIKMACLYSNGNILRLKVSTSSSVS